MTFLILIIFVSIFALSIWISRNNYKNRKDELVNNLKNFNEDIKNYYYSMEDDKKEKFVSLLNTNWKENFMSILENRFFYANNVWSVQQQIIQQQELFCELKKFNENVKDIK